MLGIKEEFATQNVLRIFQSKKATKLNLNKGHFEVPSLQVFISSSMSNIGTKATNKSGVNGIVGNPRYNNSADNPERAKSFSPLGCFANHDLQSNIIARVRHKKKKSGRYDQRGKFHIS